MERLIVKIQDLSCASCVPQIEQVMRQQEGVIWADVNFAAGEATILYDPAAFRKLKLIQAVHQLGFQIELNAEAIQPALTILRKKKPLERMQQWVHAFHIF